MTMGRPPERTGPTMPLRAATPVKRKRGFFARMRTYFLTGILVTAPIGITAWLIYSFVDYVDTNIIPLIPPRYNPEDYLEHSVPGLGVAILLIVITAIGAFVTNFMGRWLVRFGERLVGRVPVVRSIYGTLKQIFDAVLAQSSTAFREVVLVEYPRKDVWVIGFITSPPSAEIKGHVGEDRHYVFVPTSPNPTSGFLMIVKEKEVKRLAISVEEGIKLVISMGIVGGPSEKGEDGVTEPAGTDEAAPKAN